MRYTLITLSLICFIENGWAQPSDTVFVSADTLDQAKVNFSDNRPLRKMYDPHRALLLSAVIPGAGQFYNKSYWKAPIVWGGFALDYWVVRSYHNLYMKYRRDLFQYLSNRITDPTTTVSGLGLTENQLRSTIDSFRRQRDYFIIIGGIWYVLQFIEAHIDAHLKEFKINPNLDIGYIPLPSFPTVWPIMCISFNLTKP